MNGALATRSPSGAKRAQEKSSRALILVLMAVCWSDLPIASATLMKRLANRVRRIGSGPALEPVVGSVVDMILGQISMIELRDERLLDGDGLRLPNGHASL